jgi:hypothetical protein
VPRDRFAASAALTTRLKPVAELNTTASAVGAAAALALLALVAVLDAELAGTHLCPGRNEGALARLARRPRGTGC